MTASVRLVIEGRVQGVWYRGWMEERARALGLAGWVRNRSDGSVEALVSGPAEQVAAMERLCRRGPPGALVVKVAAEPAALPEQAGFHRRPTV